MNLWRVAGLLYIAGTALVARQKYRERETIHVDTIEDQLDIMIHTTQITERYPFVVIKPEDLS